MDGKKEETRPKKWGKRGRENRVFLHWARASLNRIESATEEAHVVELWQPGAADGALSGDVRAKPVCKVEVTGNVAEAEHHALRVARAARCVLQERDVLITTSVKAQAVATGSCRLYFTLVHLWDLVRKSGWPSS